MNPDPKTPCELCGLPTSLNVHLGDDTVPHWYCEECYQIGKDHAEAFKKLREVAQNQYEQGLADGSKHFRS